MYHLDPLERRELLSITWTNRGGDNFGKYFGAGAAVARQVVNEVIADYKHVFGKAKVSLRIYAANLADSDGPSTLGVTTGKKVVLDNDGAGTGWYFDPNLGDDAEHFTPHTGTAYAADADFGGHTDFYTVAAHEIAHALGFKDAKTPFRPRRGRPDTHHSNNPQDLMFPNIETDARYLISPYDVAHITGAGKRTAAPGRLFSTEPVLS